MHVIASLQDDAVSQLLLAGSVGIMPTDTVYGIVACAANREAVGALYKAKHREGKPGTIIAASVHQLIDLGISSELLAPIVHLWPASLSVIVPSASHLAYLDQGKGSVAVRVPADPAIHALLEKTGPLLTSSANQPGQPTATDLSAARAYFGRTVDFYVDGGKVADRLPSTIIRMSEDGTVELVRAGAVSIDNT